MCFFLVRKSVYPQRGERAIFVGSFTFCYHSPPYMYVYQCISLYLFFSPENDVIHFEDMYRSVEIHIQTYTHTHPGAYPLLEFIELNINSEIDRCSQICDLDVWLIFGNLPTPLFFRPSRRPDPQGRRGAIRNPSRASTDLSPFGPSAPSPRFVDPGQGST